MENPTTKGSRAPCNLFGDTMQNKPTTAAIQAQFLSARFGLYPGVAAIVAALAFGGAHNG